MTIRAWQLSRRRTARTRRGAVAPVVAAGTFGAMHGYWLVSTLAMATVVVWLYRCRGVARIAALALNAVSALGNLLLAVSLYI